jgi:hypothetical protein
VSLDFPMSDIMDTISLSKWAGNGVHIVLCRKLSNGGVHWPRFKTCVVREQELFVQGVVRGTLLANNGSRIYSLPTHRPRRCQQSLGYQQSILYCSPTRRLERGSSETLQVHNDAIRMFQFRQSTLKRLQKSKIGNAFQIMFATERRIQICAHHK